MKRLAGLSLIIGLLSLPIPAQAQLLTQGAADCALDVIRFRAWAVTGLNLIVTTEMLPSWRNYLASRYPMLPDRYSVANACWELNNVTAKWPQMPPVERELWQNIWATSLPQNLAFIEPVFPAGVQQVRAALQNAPSSAPQDTETKALEELKRRYEIGNTLLRFNRTYYGR